MNFKEYSKTVLLAFNQHRETPDKWTVDDAVKGVSIMGGTGSGKTTASGRALALKFLKEGWGGLVLCAKTDEADLWCGKDGNGGYCRQAGRQNDVIRFSNHSEYVFNALDYEMKRQGQGGGDTINLTNIFMNIFRMGNRIAQEGDTKEERFWDTALKRCLNRTIDLVKLAGVDLSYQNMVRILASSTNATPGACAEASELIELGEKDIEDYNSNSSFCLYCLVKAYMNVEHGPEDSEKSAMNDMVADYFTYSFPSMGKRTKSIVTESFMGLAEPFLSGVLKRHFAGKTNISPELAYSDQKVIVLDFPIKEYLDAGIMAQCVFKLMFQQAVERRNSDIYPIPVFLWCDEAQYFVNPYDQIFLTTARSSRTATVYLSQNISNYFAVMGSGNDAKARVDSLMGNLSTKIFHANSDAETNEYASRLIGNEITSLEGMASEKDPYFDIARSRSISFNSQYIPQVQPREFTVLKSGGEQNNYKVEAMIMTSGKLWADGKNYCTATFTQNFKT